MPFLVLWLSLSSIVQAQTIEWDKTFGGDRDEYLNIVQQTQDGGYILGGGSSSGNNGDKSQTNKGECYPWYCSYDYWIVKLDTKGNKQWDKTIGGSSSDFLTSMQQTKDGGYILGGNSNSNRSGDKSENNRNSNDYWVVKLDGNGNKQWDKTLGGSETDYLTTLQQTQDGGYILGGDSWSDDLDKSEVSKGRRDFWIIKLNADGTKIWDKTIGGNSEDRITALQQTQDAGYILGGYSSSSITGDKSEARRGGEDYWVVKLDGNGNKVWDKTLGGNSKDLLYSLQQTNDGGYILGGTSFSSKSSDKSENNTANNSYDTDYWLVKIDASGKKEWDQTLGGNGGDDLRSVQQINDGGYILGGFSRSDKKGDKSEENKGDHHDYWIIKVDAAGNKQWDQTIGGNKNDELRSLQQTHDGGFIVGGFSQSGKSGDKSEANKTINGSYEYGDPTNDYWVVKLKATGNKTQNIVFNPIPDKTIFDKSFTLQATATSGLPVLFRVVARAATVKGNVVTLTNNKKQDQVTIEAYQPGDDNFRAAPKVTRTFNVEIAFTELWERTIKGDAQLSAIVPTPEGGYLLGGSTFSGKAWYKSQPSQGASDYWIVKVDSSGHKLWDKRFGGSSFDYLKALVAAPDGGYLLGGSSASGISGDKTEARRDTVTNDDYWDYHSDYWVVKIDRNGNKLWDKTFGSDAKDEFTCLTTTPTGGFLLGGYTSGSNTGDKTDPRRDSVAYSADYWVVKIDGKGNKIWDKTFGGNYYERLTGILTAPDGYVLAGYSTSVLYDDGTVTKPTKNDYWVIKLHENGQLIWDKSYAQPGSAHSIASILATTDGNYLVGGPSRDNSNYLNYFALIKINQDGKALWSKKYTGGAQTSPLLLMNTPEGGYQLAGNVDGRDRNYLIKLDADGNQIYSHRRGTYPLRVMLPTADKGFLLGEDGYRIYRLKEADAAPPALAWNYRYGGTLNDKLTVTIPTFDHGFLVGGYSRSAKNGDKSQQRHGHEDYWLVKTDKQGKKLWDKRFGGPRHDFLNSVVQTIDGGYLLGGSSDSGIGGDKTQASQGGRDYWIVRLDENGTKLWDKRYGGSGYDELRQMQVLSNGDFLLVGYSDSPQSGDKSQDSRGSLDYWIIKIDSKGNKRWDKRYGGSANDYLQNVVTINSSSITEQGYWNFSENGFMLAGSSDSGQGGDKTQPSRGGRDYWIVKIDSTGNKLADFRFGGSGQDELYGLTAYNESDFVLAGHSDSPKGGDKSQGSLGQTDFWALYIRIDANADRISAGKIWDRRYGGKGREELRSLTYIADHEYLSKNEGFLLGGTTHLDKSGHVSQNSRGGTDYWIVRINVSTGRPLSDQRLGGNGLDELRSVVRTGENEFLLAGRSESGVSGNRTQPSQGQMDYWLIQTTLGIEPLATEKAAALIALSETTIDSSASVVLKLEQNLTAYPNPFQEKVTISFTLPETQAVTVRVLDSQGREIKTLFQQEAKANQTYQVEWQAGKQATGMYLLQLQTPTQQKTQKILLTR
ncbi:DNA helicase [Adhaeribacter pallidiroseus]|uniref:DNA helicase n=2 Tax=Adhaeribacter pallidiroseus TaxID=2072847 RepID=A0A369QKG6_9BACT|nr:DNA helicase [Adhaeribacter pallidiroseus]